MLKLQRCYFYRNTLKCVWTEKWVETVYLKVIFFFIFFSFLLHKQHTGAQVRRKGIIHPPHRVHILSKFNF